MTLLSTPLGHQMPLLGGAAHLKFWTKCVSNAFSIAFSRMSKWPYVVLLLATRCLYWGGYSSSEILNCVSNAFSIAFSRMSRWPYIVLLLATRCLTRGDSLSEGTCHLKIWAHFRIYSCFTGVFSMKDQWDNFVKIININCIWSITLYDNFDPSVMLCGPDKVSIKIRPDQSECSAPLSEDI